MGASKSGVPTVIAATVIAVVLRLCFFCVVGSRPADDVFFGLAVRVYADPANRFVFALGIFYIAASPPDSVVVESAGYAVRITTSQAACILVADDDDDGLLLSL